MGYTAWAAEHRIAKWYTPNLFFASGLLALSSLSYGFDTQTFNGLQALPAFKDQFGEANAKGVKIIPTWYLSTFNSLIFVGMMAGSIGGSYFTARFGRKKGVIAMSCWACITVVIMATSTNRWQILIGRTLNYVYIGMELVTIPLYQSEISPPAIRGFTVGSYHLCLTTGGFLMSLIIRGTSEMEGKLSWQIPFACITIFPAIIAIGTCFTPESPRWLMLKGRDEDARKALQWLHGKRIGGFDADAEVAKLRLAIDTQPEKGTYKDLITGHNRKVFAIVCGMFFFIQATGQAFSSQYGAVFIQQVSSVNPFNINIVSGVCGVAGTFWSIYFSDKFGRRFWLLLGSASLACILFSMAGAGTSDNPSKSAKTLIVACKVLFGFFYHITWGAVTNTVVTELAALHLRDKTMRLGVIIKVTTDFAVSFSLGYAIRAIGAKIGYVFGSMAVLSGIFVFFCVPECKGRGLEEVQSMFRAGVPVRQFKHYQSPVAIDTTPDTPDAAEKGKSDVFEYLDSNGAPQLVEDGKAFNAAKHQPQVMSI